MSNGQVITPVIMRICKTRAREIVAVFPTTLGTLDPETCSMYMSGQHHTGVYRRIIDFTWPALACDPRALRMKDELEAEPYMYRLKLYIRALREHHKQRRSHLLKISSQLVGSYHDGIHHSTQEL